MKSFLTLSASIGTLMVLASCSSTRFEESDGPKCYEHLGRCALNERGLAETTRIAMARVGVSPAQLKQSPLAALTSFDEQTGSDAAAQQAFVEQCVSAAQQIDEQSPDQALGLYLLAAQRSAPFIGLDGTPEEQEHFFSHAGQFATSRVVELLNGRKEVQGIPALGNRYKLSVQTSETGNRADPFKFDSLVAADKVTVNGFSKRVTQLGLGAPFVAEIKPPADPDTHPYFPLGGQFLPLTGVLSFTGSDATLTFYDSYRQDTLSVGKRNLPLSADYSAAWARSVDADPNKKAFLGLFRPASGKSFMRLTLTEPFRPDAIPVVFVHGLASNGATWDETINGLLADPTIRRRYQFWIYQYPSGYPFIYPAADLRRSIRDVRKHFDPKDRLPALDNIVLVGHSMGGLISSTQIRQTDPETLKQFFKRPLDELDVDEDTKNRLRDLLYLNPEGYIRRVIFVATPHRGSTIADGWVGRLTSRLIKLPTDIVSFNITGIMKELTDTGFSMIDLAPNSVTRLQYYNPLLKTLVELPIDKRVKFHTIAGDRGLGNAPNSSDGVVSYASSHLNGATSEKVVGARHSAHRHPKAIEEIRRILLVHLAE